MESTSLKIKMDNLMENDEGAPLYCTVREGLSEELTFKMRNELTRGRCEGTAFLTKETTTKALLNFKKVGAMSILLSLYN